MTRLSTKEVFFDKYLSNGNICTKNLILKNCVLFYTIFNLRFFYYLFFRINKKSNVLKFYSHFYLYYYLIFQLNLKKF